MTMKKAELEKRIGLKINNALNNAAQQRGAASLDRKAQRERDRALGLVPFAVKLPHDLVQQLHARVKEKGAEMNGLIEQLLRAGLSSAPTPPSPASRGG